MLCIIHLVSRAVLNVNVLNVVFVLVEDAFDNELMYQTLKDLVEGRAVEVPTYDFVTHSRLDPIYDGSHQTTRTHQGCCDHLYIEPFVPQTGEQDHGVPGRRGSV